MGADDNYVKNSRGSVCVLGWRTTSKVTLRLLRGRKESGCSGEDLV